MADKMDMVGTSSFFSKAEISLQTVGEQYLAFKARITPWSIGLVCDMVLGGRNINSIHSRFSTYEWAVHLSIIKVIFLLAEPNFRSGPFAQSSKGSANIQLLR